MAHQGCGALGPLASGHRAHHACRSCCGAKFPWAVFVWCLVSWGLLQAELNGIALSVAGPLIALFTLASAPSRAEAAIACAVMCLVLLVAPAPPEQSRVLTQLTVFQNMALALAAAFAAMPSTSTRNARAPSRSARLPPSVAATAEARRRVEAERVLHRSGGARHHGPIRCRP